MIVNMKGREPLPPTYLEKDWQKRHIWFWVILFVIVGGIIIWGFLA